MDLLKGYPFIALAAVAILLLATMVPAPIGVVAALWVILLAWLVYRRAHGTSITSAALSLTFLLALLPALTERRAAPVLSAACFCAAAWVVPHWNAVFLTHGFAADVPQQEVLEFERELSKQQRAAIYFRNYQWVGATIIPLVFAWNGSLMRSLGRDGFSGPVLSYFFPGLTFIPGDSPSDLGRLRDVASRNIAIAWVRPEGDNLTLDLPGHSLYFQTTHTGNRLVELNLIMFGGPPQSPGTAP